MIQLSKGIRASHPTMRSATRAFAAGMLLFMALLSVSVGAELPEDVVQELEDLIEKNYAGRAKALALKKLDNLLGTEDKDLLPQLRAYRNQLTAKLGIPAPDRSAEKPPPEAQVQPKDPVAPKGVPNRMIVDADGDGLNDTKDPSPVVMNPTEVRCIFKSLEFLIKYEPGTLEPKHFSFASTIDKASQHLQGLFKLPIDSAEIRDKLQLIVDDQLPWGMKNRETAKTFVEAIRKAAIAKVNFEVLLTCDISFSSRVAGQRYRLVPGAIPIAVGTRKVADADCVEQRKSIQLPKNDEAPINLRFVASIKSPEQLSILLDLEAHAPRARLNGGSMQVIDEDDIDHVKRYANARLLTNSITIRAPGGSCSWRVAKRLKGTDLTYAAALESINRLAHEEIKTRIISWDSSRFTTVFGITENPDRRWLITTPNGVITDIPGFLASPVTEDIDLIPLERADLVQDANDYREQLYLGRAPQQYLQAAKAEQFAKWSQAAQIGWPEGQFLLARCFGEGIHVDRDYARSTSLHLLAAEQGFAMAMNRLGELFNTGRGIDMDDTKAAEWFKKAAAMGDHAGMDNLARAHYYGFGVNTDPQEAARLFEAAAEGGYAYALNSIGQMYMDGKTVEPDPAKARKYLRKAAEMGLTAAMASLGKLLLYGGDGDADMNTAKLWLQRAVMGKDSGGAYHLGLMHEKGLGTPPDFAKALKFYNMAAKANNKEVYNHLGQLYEKGEGVAADTVKALMWYQQAAKAEDPAGLYNLGRFYDQGIGGNYNFIKAREYYTLAAEAGIVEAMVGLGVILEYGKRVQQDYPKARSWFEKAREKGSARAAAHLGWMYETGRGIPQNYKKAVELYLEAAQKGDPMGQTYLAFVYQFGHGLDQDWLQAAKWLRKAAEQNFPQAKYSLALLYQSGQGVEKNTEVAIKLLMEAAGLGDSRAQVYLGILYHTGRDVEQDFANAMEWYLKAAAQGESTAMVNIGNLFKSGSGVVRDLSKAREWYQKAVANGSEDGLKALKQLPTE